MALVTIDHTATVASGPAPVRPGEGPAPKRRRRTPDEARAEILDAARELLAERGAAALNVAEVMKRTTLTRKAFYVHFDDRTALLLALLQPLRAQADAALEQWAPGDGFVTDGRAALEAAARTYREHGAALRAVFWSSGEDPDVVAVRAQLVEPILAAARIAVGQAGTPLREPEATAVALATMNVHVLLDHAPGATDAELARLTAALYDVWERTLDLAAPGARAAG